MSSRLSAMTREERNRKAKEDAIRTIRAIREIRELRMANKHVPVKSMSLHLRRSPRIAGKVAAMERIPTRPTKQRAVTTIAPVPVPVPTLVPTSPDGNSSLEAFQTLMKVALVVGICMILSQPFVVNGFLNCFTYISNKYTL